LSDIKVMIVDDSAFMRKVIEEILNSQKNIKVVAKARNGKEALRKLDKNKPDVITMDIEMPVMNGLEALEAIMRKKPTPVIMFINSTDKEATETVKALSIGAVDFILKPSSLITKDLSGLQKELIKKVEIAASVRLAGYKLYKNGSIRLLQNKSNKANGINNIIAIGTSTGGPRALQEVLTGIPGNIDGAVLIVQHMPGGFTKSLADRLNGICMLKIKEAEDGETICPGCGYIAPGGLHMRLSGSKIRGEYIIKLGRDEVVSGHRPSVDVLFESLSHVKVNRMVAVIMTGMGSDGAISMKNLKENNNCCTIAQDEETSTVFGMPKSAIKLGAVDKVVSLQNISHEILKFLGV